MKQLFGLFLLSGLSFSAQQQHYCSKQKSQMHLPSDAKISALSPQIVHEVKYDVKFVHLNLELERNTKYVKGNVRTVATVTATSLDTFQTLLHVNHSVDSVRFNGQLLPALRQDSMIKVKPASPLANGSSFTVTIYYKGTAPSGGSAIGSGYNLGTSPSWGNQATWSLSEALVAYHWWPTKQMLTDKIDSSWVFVLTDSTNRVGSNGRLTNVAIIGNKKRYEWKSRTPIDYYLVSVSTAKYKEYIQYAKPLYLVNDSILIQNYIYDAAINNNNWINNQKSELDQLPHVLEFLSEKYGMYPFYKEKYGHCMAPLGGGMEHQTMTTLGFFDYYIDAHELGHQWWGDNVTCKSWGDIWINEGFASYTEHLVAQFLDPSNFAGNLNAAHTSVMQQPGGSIFFTGADTLDSGRIFDSRLTYDKGGAIIHSLRFMTNNDSLWFGFLRYYQNLHKNGNGSALSFQSDYQTFTSITPTQFFTQWYYGEGYPTFDIRYNFAGGQFFMKSTQSVSMPGVTPLFITPVEYKISRAGKPDTTIRVQHAQAVENYTLPLTGTVTAVQCDPKNWLINKVLGSVRDMTLGVGVDPVGINTAHEEPQTLELGPNPCRQQLFVRNASNADLSYRIFDLSGKLVQAGRPQTGDLIDLSVLKAGLYQVSLVNAGGETLLSRKIIHQ